MKKIDDLMELVKGCGVATTADTSKVPTARETMDLLMELGFSQAAYNINKRINPLMKKSELAAGGYIEITPTKIQDFLARKAREYDKKQMGRIKKFENLAQIRTYLHHTSLRGDTLANFAQQTNRTWMSNTTATLQLPPEQFSAQTVDYAGDGDIGQFIWTEVPIEMYVNIPPLNVLEKLREEKAKKLFDSFSIASVNSVRDPLLLGRILGSESRYFISQWGDDVALDDII